MKTIAYALIFALFLIGFASPWSTSAHASGPSASGVYRFVMEDELTKQLEFDVRSDERGTATGQMTFRDAAGAVDRDPDGEQREETPAEFYLTADLDTLTIENNRALMTGTVRDSSLKSYIGKWVLLVVEDNGDGQEVPDKFTWQIYQPEAGGWVPQDSEDPRDEGAYFKWWATDAEREDDRGIQSVNIIPGTRQGCPTLPLQTYDLPDVRGEGQIQVQP